MTVREVALRLLSEYEASGKYVNLSLSSHLADNFSAEERAFLTALLYTAVERKLTYDYYIAAISERNIKDIAPRTKNILRLGLCQLIHIDSLPDFAAVNETVKLAKNSGERAFVNGVLRSAARKKESGELPLPDKDKNYLRYLSVRESFPLDTLKLLAAEYGISDTEKMLAVFNSRRTTDITVNTCKISRDEYLEILKAAGYNAAPSELSQMAITVASSVNPRELPHFGEGFFFVQDASCALSAELLSVSEGDLVIDVCSAPGGKSFAAAIHANNNAEIRSFDIHESKLSLIRAGADRLGLSSVKAFVRDALFPDEELLGRADRVICDVPCSGLGVLGKKPDLRYNAGARQGELPEIQYSILKASAEYLKSGGRLVYSTCTLSPSENREVVLRFLSENPEFKLRKFAVLGEVCNGMVTLLPHIHGTDGFFISVMEKN